MNIMIREKEIIVLLTSLSPLFSDRDEWRKIMGKLKDDLRAGI